MDRVPVSSSTLASVGYDSESSTLELEFTTGAVYQYFNVPPRVHEELMAAGSLGAYFNEVVKAEGYSFIRIS